MDQIPGLAGADAAGVYDRKISERLRLIREAAFAAGGVVAAARAVGVPRQTWSNYELGVIIPGDILLAFLVTTWAEPRWLLTGTGPMFRDPADGTAPPIESDRG